MNFNRIKNMKNVRQSLIVDKKKTGNSQHKCNFCNSKGIIINRIIVATRPTKAQGYMHYDYFGDAIFTCNRHVLNVQANSIKDVD